ncbi:MAG: hypothetical protein DWP98_06910 [Bacteroidetes bacterium]|nr:MAG: hypothetical protein DWP98_06910 [Bacteroidota bacterium]MBL1143955.1 hypothetical protein [Bacteroidota bacterium]MCB0802395.1 hypothetical protein [Flavobacteriales bacterium]NOG56756.1 hypothetical protein [Bacteroidota bacterium]
MKNLIGIVLLLVLIAAAYFLYTSNSSVTKQERDFKDFAIEDTSAIDQVFISRLSGEKVLITRREDGIWRVNGEYIARVDAIGLILKTAHDITIQSPVSKGYLPSIIKRLATSSTKVEFYAGKDEPIKTWYISHATGTNVGTYMLLEKDGIKSSKPYITHLLMERGFLGSRFFTDATVWKDRAMLKLKPESIKSVEVIHASDTSTSFKLENLGQSRFQITNLKVNSLTAVDPNIAIPYLKQFKGVYYEYVDTKTPIEKLDSVYNRIPRHSIKVLDNEQNKYTINLYNLPVRPGSELNGKPIFFNPERMYAYSSELGPDVHAIVPNLNFDPLVPSFEHFISSTTVEK